MVAAQAVRVPRVFMPSVAAAGVVVPVSAHNTPEPLLPM
jgi:hypothetical protein